MKYLLILIALVSSTALSSQDLGMIKGHVTDSEMDNAPMMMASITLKGSGSNRQTNLHGNFEIEDVLPGDYILTVSFSGYDSKEIPVEVKTNKVTEVTASLAAKTLDPDLAFLLSENDIPEQQTINKAGKKGI